MHFLIILIFKQAVLSNCEMFLRHLDLIVIHYFLLKIAPKFAPAINYQFSNV